MQLRKITLSHHHICIFYMRNLRVNVCVCMFPHRLLSLFNTVMSSNKKLELHCCSKCLMFISHFFLNSKEKYNRFRINPHICSTICIRQFSELFREFHACGKALSYYRLFSCGSQWHQGKVT